MINLFVKGLIGAIIVILISLLAKTKYYFLAGMIPLFPTFAVMAHYIAGKANTNAEFKNVLLFGMWSLLPYFAYLLTVYLLHSRETLVVTLFSGIIVWFVVAAPLVYFWQR